MRAFIFSLDAFVAFTLALVAIYSLIFFSSVPSAYYYLLTQGHYLSRDILLSISTSTCGDALGQGLYTATCVNPSESVMDNIATMNNPVPLINSTIGVMVPRQFGYVVELSNDSGNTWTVLYDTSAESGDQHANMSRKLAVATQVMTFGYSGNVNKLSNSPYEYCSCGPQAQSCSGSGGGGNGGSGSGTDLGIITCGEFTTSSSSNGSTTTNTQVTGNTNPENILGPLVPQMSVKIMKLTVYI